MEKAEADVAAFLSSFEEDEDEGEELALDLGSMVLEAADAL